MLKILKMGDETHKIYHVNCYNCGCVFETNYDKKIMSRNYASLLFTIECPCCGEVNNSDDYKIRYLSKKEYEEWKKNPDKPEVLKKD